MFFLDFHYLLYKSILFIPNSMMEIYFFDQSYNKAFYKKLLSSQKNFCLAIAGAIMKTFKENLYQEKHLESLKDTLWYRKIGVVYKNFKNESPSYLFIQIFASNQWHSILIGYNSWISSIIL